MPEPIADLPALPHQIGTACGIGLVGAVGLLVTAATAERWWIPLVSAVMTLAITCPLFWLSGRFTQRHSLDGLPQVAGPPRRSAAVATRFGFFRGVLCGAVALLVTAFLDRALGGSAGDNVAGPVLIGLALGSTSTIRKQRRQQDERGVLLCSAVGARRLAWTRASARRGLVVVPAND